MTTESQLPPKEENWRVIYNAFRACQDHLNRITLEQRSAVIEELVNELEAEKKSARKAAA